MNLNYHAKIRLLINLFQNSLYQSRYKSIFLKLGNHCVLALIALIVIGGATRVMEAGLACPDWPLCYGTFLPLKHMNLRVFLEWFHRLDAFFVGLLILSKFILSIIWRKDLPNWLPKTYSFFKNLHRLLMENYWNSQILKIFKIKEVLSITFHRFMSGKKD